MSQAVIMLTDPTISTAPQSLIRATPYAPRIIAPRLKLEMVFGNTIAASIRNRANPPWNTLAPISCLILVAGGTGGTNGTYPLVFSSGAAAGTVTVQGNIVSISGLALTAAGLYATPPTVTSPAAAAAGLTGLSITAKLGMPSFAGAPVIQQHAAQLATTAQIDTGIMPNWSDQFWAMVARKPSGTTNMVKAAVGTASVGFIDTGTQIGFYNSQSGAAGPVAYTNWADATNYNLVIGWGRAGQPGNITCCALAALGAIVTGSANGVARSGIGTTTDPTLRVAQGSGGATTDIAYLAGGDYSDLSDAAFMAALATWPVHLRNTNNPLGVTLA